MKSQNEYLTADGKASHSQMKKMSSGKEDKKIDDDEKRWQRELQHPYFSLVRSETH